MVDALSEACRVLTPAGVLIDVRPVTAPIVLEIRIADQVLWAKPVETFSQPEDVVAADDAIKVAISNGWFAYDARVAFDFEIDCDSTRELREYAEARKLRGAEIPYADLDNRLREFRAKGRESRLGCRRPWSLSRYRKRIVAFV